MGFFGIMIFCGSVYLIIFGISVSVDDFLSFIFFKAIPFFIELMSFVGSLKVLGIV